MSEKSISGVVLAGQRSKESALLRKANVSLEIMVPVAGKASLVRVLDALRDSSLVQPRVLVGPDANMLAATEAARRLIHEYQVEWVPPAEDPASSAIIGSETLQYPLLVTTADHALLTPELIDDFCTAALNQEADFFCALVPFKLVQRAYPKSRRTVLRFSDESFCGANLFFVKNASGLRAFKFWREMQEYRKRPYIIALKLGLTLFSKYILSRLSLKIALMRLSELAGCKLGVIKLKAARAAIDVDCLDEWQLAGSIILQEGEAR